MIKDMLMFSIGNLLILAFFYLIIYITLFSFLKQWNYRLYTILIICFLLHLILLGIIQLVLNTHPEPWHSFFFDDGEYYSMHAHIISSILTNKPLSYITSLRAANYWVSDFSQRGMMPPVHGYQVGYITYFYGILYSIFGYYPLIINLWNITLHLLSGILIFKISKILFDQKTGYIATVLFLFNPTLFYYTTTKVAESSYILLICLIIYLCLSINKRYYCVFKLLMLTMALFLLNLLKYMLFLPLLFSILVYLAILTVSHFKKIKTLFFALFISLFLFHQKLLEFFNLIFCNLATVHKTYSTSGGQNYELFKFGHNFTKYTFVQKLAYMFFSWIHLIVEPTRYSSIRYGLYYPYQIIFIVLFILALFGMVISIKTQNIKSVLLMVYLFFMGSLIAGASGNAGTMLRHRDIITFVVFIFAAFYIRIKIFDRRVNNIEKL
ncbi:MAG: glycosyltransferase family 39 protein [Candidatus Omnitrophota bacterium]|nr:glycosyltransferase family 39 protein [Candidatus Omnitrophota bacterium]